MSPLVRGGVAGLLATGSHTAVMYAGKAAGLMGTPPPKQITHRAHEKAGGNPEERSAETFNAAWLASHAGFGAACGVGYSLLRPLIPGPSAIKGLLFGLAIWGTSYLKVLPALGLYPPPEGDSPSRTAVMVAAHLVYGETLAQAESCL